MKKGYANEIYVEFADGPSSWPQCRPPRLAMATLLSLALASAGASDVPFEATFSALETIGSSNYTHFWMPTPLARLSAAPTAPLFAHVDLCGDGGACPPPGHPQQHTAYFSEPAAGGRWARDAHALAANALIRLNATATRGLGGITLDPATNNTATVTYNDWSTDSAGRISTPPRAGTAAVTGLPDMGQIAYFQSTPSAILPTGGGGDVALAQFYGYGAAAVGLGGCTAIKSRGCYSTFTLASHDKGASWQFRSAIHWDKRMPAHVEGPCEPTLVTLPDGKTLLSIFRLKGAGGNLWQATSADAGRTWSAAVETNAWAVFPQAKVLPSGALVLTAGRPGIGLWLADGRGAAGPDPTSWKFHNLAKAHNTLVGASKMDPAMLYPAAELAVANCSSTPSSPAATKAYTGLETMGCDDKISKSCTLVVSYDRLANGNAGPDPGPGPHGAVDAAFTMRVTVKALK